jgi:hypothetical protein
MSLLSRTRLAGSAQKPYGSRFEDLGTGRVNLWLSTEAEHDPVLLAADVPPRDADFARRAVGESLKHLRLYEPTRQSLAPAGSQGIHYGRPFVEV